MKLRCLVLLFSTLIVEDILAFVKLPCLTNESADFSLSKKALKDLEVYLHQGLEALKTKATEKIQMVEKDFSLIDTEGKERKWKKYKGHCYYFSTDKKDWFSAEHFCRQIGGYFVKLDDAKEDAWVYANREIKSDTFIGLIDLVEGQYRWTLDHSKPYNSKWVKGYGSRGPKYNCVAMNQGSGASYGWYDQSCTYKMPYVCESNICY